MAEHEDAARAKLVAKSGPERLLCLFAEIDHDVPAENHVERPLHRPGPQQIEMPKGDQSFQFLAYAERIGICPFHETAFFTAPDRKHLVQT